MAQKSRNWMITIFEDWPEIWSDFDFDKYFKLLGDIKYACIGLEIAPTTGNKHLHMYVEFPNARHFTALKKIFPTARLDSRRGTSKQADEYCMKDGRYKTTGTRNKQGKRTDLQFCREMIITDNFNMRESILEATSSQSIRTCEKLLQYFEKKRDWKPTVLWIHGPTGTGKTRACIEWCKKNEIDYWVSMKNLKWWEGYDKHDAIIIDDFREDFCSFQELLRILDRYEYRIEVKGSSRQLLAKYIFITTPLSPLKTYTESSEDIKQLTRRISSIICTDNYSKNISGTGTEVGEVILEPLLLTLPDLGTSDWELLEIC